MSVPISATVCTGRPRLAPAFSLARSLRVDPTFGLSRARPQRHRTLGRSLQSRQPVRRWRRSNGTLARSGHTGSRTHGGPRSGSTHRTTDSQRVYLRPEWYRQGEFCAPHQFVVSAECLVGVGVLDGIAVARVSVTGVEVSLCEIVVDHYVVYLPLREQLAGQPLKRGVFAAGEHVEHLSEFDSSFLCLLEPSQLFAGKSMLSNIDFKSPLKIIKEQALRVATETDLAHLSSPVTFVIPDDIYVEPAKWPFNESIPRSLPGSRKDRKISEFKNPGHCQRRSSPANDTL